MISEEVQKLSDLWDYTAEKVGESKATKLLDHLGLDNPHMSRTNTLEHWKKTIDKFLQFQKILRGQ